MSLVHRRNAPGDDITDSGVHPLDRLLAQGRPIVMGILNLTPDSFADGGRFDEPTRAISSTWAGSRRAPTPAWIRFRPTRNSRG
jgi:hypothetical protein